MSSFRRSAIARPPRWTPLMFSAVIKMFRTIAMPNSFMWGMFGISIMFFAWLVTIRHVVVFISRRLRNLRRFGALRGLRKPRGLGELGRLGMPRGLRELGKFRMLRGLRVFRRLRVFGGLRVVGRFWVVGRLRVPRTPMSGAMWMSPPWWPPTWRPPPSPFSMPMSRRMPMTRRMPMPRLFVLPLWFLPCHIQP